METVIVTGGNGYIGSHMCRYLCELGLDVQIVDNFSTSPLRPMHSFGTFHNFDIADKEKMEQLIRTTKCKTIFHFAAKATVSESEKYPMLYYRENLIKSTELMDIAVSEGIEYFIFSSTCATFGIPKTPLISEKTEQLPVNTYGKTKLLLEMVLKDLAEKKKFKGVASLRYFNAAGCSPDGVLGENHEPEYHLIPNLVKAGVTKQPFYLFGDKHETPDGSCIRDYVHVCDLADAHFKAWNYIKDNGGFHDFNLGSGNGHSNKEMIKLFEEISKIKLNLIIAEPRAGDPPTLVADSSKAKKILKWSPQYSIEDSIVHTFNYKKGQP